MPKVEIKDFGAKIRVKRRGIEIGVGGPSGHRGDLIISNTGLTWCVGRTRRENGVSLTWSEFERIMDTFPD